MDKADLYARDISDLTWRKSTQEFSRWPPVRRWLSLAAAP